VPRSYRFTQCDVFTERPLQGNALAVFTDARGLSDGELAALARETNLSETTFVLPPSAGGDFRVRIFTPARELPFAGHPLIGTAVVVGRSLAIDRLALETGIGVVLLDLVREGGATVAAWMEQPEPLFGTAPDEDAAAVAAALGLSPRPLVIGANGVRVGLVEATADELAALAPDHHALARVPGLDLVSVYAPPDDGAEVRVRVFAPWVGVAEDPGTGVAAGPLAEHLVERGLVAAGELTIRQGVEIGRPSLIAVRAGEGPPRVGGAVAVVARGTYTLP
jgi:trans-2,3-dihydro-3-hydroxyanthranilate isomerase